eukprot:TRINITY_DN60252_c0_g1_i1.p1 TRINITY_DN60252_c0_g1~~TRINITY_DN60252_c0_g1_i1.p1  ORF type:complete len:592 (+),score=171.38 TRINITY_DN60252_c0_g1_i1:76-1776(+)
MGALMCLVPFVGALSAAVGHGPCWPFDECPQWPTPLRPGQYPTSYNYSGTFPEGFVWGLGTAAYQVEGAYREGGRGASIWDTYTGADTVGMPGSVCTTAPCPINPAMYAKGATGNVANDHYHRRSEDVQMMRQMGLKNYRFSIAWPRIVPTGNVSDGISEEGIAWYSGLIDELLAAGITPAVTLYHWDLPQGLLNPGQGKYGWWSDPAAPLTPNKMIVEQFTAYADLCFARFGDRVKHWFTFNEAWTFTWLASGGGKAPSQEPYMDKRVWPWVAGHNVLLAHAHAVDTYRSKYQKAQKGLIGITNNADWREPRTTNQADITAAERMMEFCLGWFADPIWLGDYPVAMRRILADRLPEFTAEERKLLKGSADFFGLNSYGASWATDDQTAPGFMEAWGQTSEDGFPRAQSVWLYSVPWGIRKLVNWITRRYSRPAIYVTEGGWSLAASNASAGVVDPERTYYYANYTSSLLAAVNEDGVDLRGYYAWSLMDNFEWERGYTERFGVVFNDFGFGDDPLSPPGWAGKPTLKQKRTRKGSSRWLQRVWEGNRLVDPASVAAGESQGVLAI